MRAAETQTRVSIKNILYATDFSPIAEAAAPYALELARRYGSKVFALHVRPLQIYGLAPAESWPDLRAAAEEQAKDQAKHMDKLFQDVEHAAVIGEGDIWEVISMILEKNRIDLIVLGTHGRKGLEKVLMGSVAEAVFRRVSCPVLTVGPFVHGNAKRAAEMKRILFASDFSEASEGAVPYALSLAQENQANLDLVHVIETVKSGVLAHPEEAVSGCIQRMRALVPPEAELWCEPNVMIEVGEPAQQILNVAKARRSDVIVLGVKQPEGLRSSTRLPWAIAHKIVSQAECPVLTVRGPQR
jgi:nucleotide-binding universal stress UspA family protein